MGDIMKKLIRISLATLTFAFMNTVDAKRVTRKPAQKNTIQVSKNKKQMFVDTKKLKNASSPQEKVVAAEKLAADIKSNPDTQLIFVEQRLLEEIKNLENSIASKESYISYFDTEEVKEDKEVLELLYQDLAEVQTQLKKTITNQPKAVSLLNYWSVRALIATVGLAIADQLITGGEGRKALMTGASTAGKRISSVASTATDYLPSGSDILEKTKSAINYGGTFAGYGLTLYQIKDFINRLSDDLSEEKDKPNPDQQRIGSLEKQIAELKIAEQKKQQAQK